MTYKVCIHVRKIEIHVQFIIYMHDTFHVYLQGTVQNMMLYMSCMCVHMKLHMYVCMYIYMYTYMTYYM